MSERAATLPATAPMTSAPPRALGGVAFLGLGTALPPGVVDNESVGAMAGVDQEWIIKRTGIRRRRWAAPGDRLHELAARAARDAGRLHPGQRILLAAFGAGFTWGATTITWGGADAA